MKKILILVIILCAQNVYSQDTKGRFENNSPVSIFQKNCRKHKMYLSSDNLVNIDYDYGYMNIPGIGGYIPVPGLPLTRFYSFKGGIDCKVTDNFHDGLVRNRRGVLVSAAIDGGSTIVCLDSEDNKFCKVKKTYKR